MFGFVFNLVGGAYKIPMIVGGITLAIASFWTWLAVHDHNIRKEAIAEFNAAQEQLLAEKQAEFESQMKLLGEEANKLKKEIEEKNKDIQTLSEDIEKNMTSKDGAMSASPYLKEIIQRMQKNFGEKK
jgi:ribosomal protein S15P/S13E